MRRCKLQVFERRAESAWFQRLKLNYDEPVSNFAFNSNLRPYILDIFAIDEILFEFQASFSVRPARYCSSAPRHRMPSNSGN